ncbi:hypothetical protein C8J57DRAFT_1707900 [Mycena rebaudengoi]|nr:hypothetical protein C8J57DRAFT_1707900 [Mycena rebaudengoi]
MSRPSPNPRAHRRVVCILPPRASTPRLAREKSTLLPYYHSPEVPCSSIAPPPPPPPVFSTSDLRRPPIDPRKAKRYCTDFGFGRTTTTKDDKLLQLPPPPPFFMYHHDNSSSAGSTPLATYTDSTDSDVSSFYDELDLEFPHPPVSPALRRMQSSPLFTLEETDAVREFLRHRWGAAQLPVRKARKGAAPGLAVVVDPTAYPPSSEHDAADFSWDAESPVCSPTLELQGEALVQGAAAASDRASWLQLEENADLLPLRPKRPAGLPASPLSYASSRRVLRRAASLASPIFEQHTTPPPLPKSRSLRFVPEPRPFDASPHSTNPYLPSLASAGRQKPSHRPNLSVPVLGLGFTTDRPAALGPSFTHRPARSQPVNRPPRANEAKSFIDLTPEKRRESTTRLLNRERVKKLLSRASSGFIGWGKSLSFATSKKNRSE